VQGFVIQELDAAKHVVFQWRTFDHYKITDAVNVDLTADWIDAVHMNSVALDNDDNLLVSSRNLNEVTKIDHQTGAIIWRLGRNAVNNQFTFVNDPRGFAYQHDARRLPNGHITLFDNGNFLNPQTSRAIEYALDEQAKVATLVDRASKELRAYAIVGGVFAILYAAALVVWFTLRRHIGQAGFYVLFALVVTQSVQLVGIYLVFASLIVPALAAKRFAEGSRLAIGYAVGLIGYVLGLVASSLFDLPTGAVIVVSLLVTFICAVVISLTVPVRLRAVTP